MPNYNRLIVIGHLTRDPELKDLSGHTLCVGGIAFSTGYGDKQKTTFLDFKAWGKTGEIIASKLGKGDAVLLEGELEQETWEDKGGGGKRSKHIMNVSRMSFMGGKSEGQRQAAPTRQAPAKTAPPASTCEDDEPPF